MVLLSPVQTIRILITLEFDKHFNIEDWSFKHNSMAHKERTEIIADEHLT